MTLTVEGAGICLHVVMLIRCISDRRPCFIAVQRDIRRQHGARIKVLRLAVGTVDDIPEPFQPLGGTDLIRIVLRTAAGDESGDAVDPA